MSKDTTIRVISAIVGLVVFFLVVLSNSIVFNIALGVIILFMLLEFLHAFKYGITLKLTALAASLFIIYSFCSYKYDILALTLISFIAVLITESIFLHKTISFNDISNVLFATLYISIFSSFIALMRSFGEFEIYYLCLLFTCAWISDTGAYFMGRFFGRRKLAPDISPKKTIAGSIGGIAFAAVGCMILGAVSVFISKSNPNYIVLAIIGAFGSCLAQIGDLGASIIKRSCGVKDFGNIMPGHGGMLDRFDSVIFIAPFIFFACYFLETFGIYLF